MIRRLLLVVIATLLTSTACKDLLYNFPIGTMTVQHFQCFKQSYDDVIATISFTKTGMIEVDRKTFLNAKAAGLKMHIAFTPCRSLPADQQVNQIIKKLGIDIERVWVYPSDATTDGCFWEDSDPESNCMFLQSILSTLKKSGFKTGVGALMDYWTPIFGSDFGCPQVSNELLAWIPTKDQQDEKPSLQPYYKIGGWQKPYMKYYKIEGVCDGAYFYNYYE